MEIAEIVERLPEFERLIELVDTNEITVKNAEEIVLRTMLDEGLDPDTVIEQEGLGRSDEETVAMAVAEAIEENPEAVEDVRSGETEAINFLVGQVMQKTQGQADPGTVNALLRSELDPGEE